MGREQVGAKYIGQDRERILREDNPPMAEEVKASRIKKGEKIGPGVYKGIREEDVASDQVVAPPKLELLRGGKNGQASPDNTRRSSDPSIFRSVDSRPHRKKKV